MWRFKFLSLAVAGAIVAASLLAPARAHASSAIGFGGIILYTYYACENGPVYVLVQEYVTGAWIPLAYQPWSRLNMYYALSSGNAILGTYLPIPGECVISYYPYYALTYLGEFSSYPFSGVGTSLLPAV